jgi:hypothetical protein
MRKVRLAPPKPPREWGSFNIWLHELWSRVGEGPFLVQGYSRASLPDASEWEDDTFSALIYVYDSTGTPAKILAYSDGTNWLRVDTGVAV